MIKIKNLHKSYQMGKNSLHVLKGIDFEVKEGELVAIMGSSGSGKSTLLNIVGMLDNYDEGSYELGEVLIKKMDETKAAKYRNKFLGFVFQSFNLINYKNALENVVLPLYYQGVSRKEREEKALKYLADVGLKEWATHLPTELSGGQKQRVAIARAMVGEPKVLLADEPTGALDSKTSKEVMDLIQKINKAGKTILVVTHEQDIAEMCSRIVKLKDGVIVEDKKNQTKESVIMFNRDRWLEIFDTISKNKLRTSLAGVTVALGILIFVVLYGLGNGLENTFEKFFKQEQLNTIWINPGRTSKPYAGFESNRRIEFDNDDYADIAEKFNFFIEGMTPRISLTGSNISYKLKSNNFSVRGVGPSHQKNEMTIMMQGRYLNDADVINKERYVVIGRLVKQDLFGDEDPIGKFINGGGRTWKVIGVYQDDDGDNEERIIYAPYTTIQSIQRGTDNVGQIIITYKPEIGFDGALEFEKQIKRYIKNRKKIDPTDPRGVFIRSASSDLKENEDFSSALKMIITFVGLGTLLAGVIGISNIMVYVVRERTKELGIRKAIGATPKSIVWMVLQESIFITTISGYIGLFTGVLFLSSLGNALEEDFYILDPYVDLNTGIFATIMLIVFGGIAGFIPARRAAKIKPIEALNDK